MNKKDDLRLLILTFFSLSSIILMLLFLCYKIVISIIHTFVYLTGLATILLVVVFYIAVIGFCISKLYRRYKSCKRSHLNKCEILIIMIKTEFIIFLQLATLYLILSLCLNFLP